MPVLYRNIRYISNTVVLWLWNYTLLLFCSWDRNVMKKTRFWFNIKMSSYQYRKSRCGDKMILRPSYLHNGISYTGKTTSWIGTQYNAMDTYAVGSYLGICGGLHFVTVWTWHGYSTSDGIVLAPLGKWASWTSKRCQSFFQFWQESVTLASVFHRY